MTASAVHAFGTLLKMEDTPGSGTYTTVAEVREVPVPALEGATIDVTTHDSPSGVREYIANIPGLGDLTFDIFYRPSHATHDENTGLLSKCLTRALTRFKVVYNTVSPKVATFDAYVIRFAPRAPVDNVWTSNIRMQVASVPTWATT